MKLTPAQFDSAFEAFVRAIAEAGSESELARIIGCTAGNVNQLRRKRKLLPPRFVIDVERSLEVPRHELRPDIYPVEDAAPPVPHAPHPAGQPPASAPCPPSEEAGGSTSADPSGDAA